MSCIMRCYLLASFLHPLCTVNDFHKFVYLFHMWSSKSLSYTIVFLCQYWSHNVILVMVLYRVGVVFCGRQSPGGHNIICGLYDAMKLHNPKSTLLGFCGAYALTIYLIYNGQRVYFIVHCFNFLSSGLFLEGISLKLLLSGDMLVRQIIA